MFTIFFLWLLIFILILEKWVYFFVYKTLYIHIQTDAYGPDVPASKERISAYLFFLCCS